MSAPVPPREWSAETKRLWRELWASERAASMAPPLQAAVWRLFGWYHRRNLLERRVDRLFAMPRGKAKDPLIASGSTGQPKVNPLVDELRSIEAQIETLERRVFGADASAPAAAGGGASDPAALLAAANKRFNELAGALEAGDAQDPRLELVQGGKSATA